MAQPEERVRVGVSTCLLGEKVRYDGGHKKDSYLTGVLGAHVEWVPVCPEVEMGLGAPRPRMRLIAQEGEPRLVAQPSGIDHTDDMMRWTRDALDRLERERLDGYVFKKDSPTCGIARVRVYNDKGMPSRNGRGLFAAALMRRMPMLPVEDEGRLHDARIRENFVERIFAHRRWRELLDSRPRARDLVAFHTDAKYAILAHSPKIYAELGRIVASAGTRPIAEVLAEYGPKYGEALRAHATPAKHANVLQHLAGMLKKEIDASDRQELAGTIHAYREGRVPLIVPLTLLGHHLRRHPVEWAVRQTYLSPYPAELALRNHV